MQSLSHLLLKFLELRPHAVASGFPDVRESFPAARGAIEDKKIQKVLLRPQHDPWGISPRVCPRACGLRPKWGSPPQSVRLAPAPPRLPALIDNPRTLPRLGPP